MKNLLTTKTAAARLKISIRRIQAMITIGCLPAEKIGRDWMIRAGDLEKFKPRKPGRPPKVG